jgi:L-gulonolactone oxidase
VTASVAGVVDQPPDGRWRPLGAGLSASPLVVTDGHLVRTPLSAPEIDTHGAQVQVSGGATVGQVAAWLAERGWWLPTVGTNASPTFGGATATCVHGTSRDHGTLSGAIRGLELLTVGGDRVSIGPDHPDLPALRVHLGAFGRVERLALAVVQGAWLTVTTDVHTVDEVLDSSFRATAEQTDAWWRVGAREVVVVRRSRTDPPTEPTRHRVRRLWTEDVPLHIVAGVGIVSAHLAPGLPSQLLRRLWRTRSHGEVGRWDRVALGSRWFRAASIELAVPAEHGAEALALVEEALRGAPVHVPVNLRWTRGDERTWLSPAEDRDVLWIDVAWHPRVPGLSRWLRAVEAALAALHARPHWGKLAWADSLASYPHAAKWSEARARHDPSRRLLNAHLERLLSSAGPGTTARTGRSPDGTT